MRSRDSQQYFDGVANQWEEMRKAFFSDTVREIAIAKANPRAGRTAADLGAGTGFITEGLIRRCLRVLAVNQSQAMLDVLKQKFAGAQGLECQLGEAESLPIEVGSVDFVFSSMYLHHVDAPSKAVEEMARVLTPGDGLSSRIWIGALSSSSVRSSTTAGWGLIAMRSAGGCPRPDSRKSKWMASSRAAAPRHPAGASRPV